MPCSRLMACISIVLLVRTALAADPACVRESLGSTLREAYEAHPTLQPTQAATPPLVRAPVPQPIQPHGAPDARLTSSHSNVPRYEGHYETLHTIPDGQGGRLYLVRRTGTEIDYVSNLENMTELARRYPNFARRLGVRVRSGHIEYPDVAGLNRRARQNGLAVRFRLDSAGQASVMTYARAWADNASVIISANGRYHFHDMGVHALGFAAMPTEVIRASQARMRTLLRLLDEFEATNPALARAVRSEIENLVELLDTQSATVTVQLSQGQSPAVALSAISRGDASLARRFSGFSLPREQQARLRRILDDARTPDVGLTRLNQLTSHMLQNLD